MAGPTAATQATSAQPTRDEFAWPVKHHSVTSGFGPRSSPGGIGSTYHEGLDIIGDPAICAVMDGRTESGLGGGYGNDLIIRHNSGLRTLYGHMSSHMAVGKPVTQGQRIGTMGATGAATGVHLHFGVEKHGSFVDPMPYLSGAADPSGAAGPGEGGPQTGDTTSEGGRAAAFAALFDLPGVMNFAEAAFMTGDKSIYNDEPLLPFIQELAKASMRHFQSLPNGTFYGFFPDQFGAYHHRKPYWEIDDIEIMAGTIQLTDDALSTHVFVTGDTNMTQEIDQADMLTSKGVITIYDAFTSAFFTDDTEDTPTDKIEGQTKAIQFLKRYGVRPLVEPDTMIRNGFFEVFYAFTRFQQQWSSQFATVLEFTFMPELYPGGIVAFPKHGLQMYVEGVSHQFDYTSGFTTNAMLSSTAAYGNGNKAIAQGMVRPVDKQIAAIPDDLNEEPAKPTKKPTKPSGTPMGGPR